MCKGNPKYTILKRILIFTKKDGGGDKGVNSLFQRGTSFFYDGL